jgi:hypothetical protein
VFHAANIARSAAISSVMRATGWSNCAPKRFSIWVRTWVPRPRKKRPELSN